MTAKASALTSINGIVFALDHRDKRPTVELLDLVRKLASDAITVLKEPDPLNKKIGFILLAIQQSTVVEIKVLNKKRVTRVTILDNTIYNWALEEIHLLAGSM
jgi:hypothetical protein